MKNKFIIPSFLIFFISYHVNAQLTVSLSANDTLICSGDSVILTANIVNTSAFISLEDFEDANLDTSVFIPNTSIDFSNPCGSGPSGSTIHCWFGSLSSFPRVLETKSLLLDSSYSISFDIRYAADENTVDCEDPDQPNEGVHFQYSLDNGANWIEIEYWTPNTMYVGQIYSWLFYATAIPTTAICNPVKFRWWQDLTSGNTWDHWGIDNICITTDTGMTISWHHDSLIHHTTTTVFPVCDTTYYITIYDSINGISVTDSVFIDVAIIDTTITQNVNTLFIVEPYATYQWIDCDSNINIPGATTQLFEINHSGNYAVDIISQYGCHIQTTCQPFIFDNIEDYGSIEIKCYPNPANNVLFIESEIIIQQIQILDLSGRVLYSEKSESSEISIDVSSLSDGEYIINIEFEDGAVNKRFSKITI